MTEEECINRVKEEAQARCRDLYPGAKLSIGEPVALPPQEGWLGGYPYPDRIWMVEAKVDTRMGERSGCFYCDYWGQRIQT